MSKGAVLNQKQEVDLTGYLQQSDVVNTVTQGNQSPVSSGAVYTAIQQSQSAGLNWNLIASGLNTVTFTVPDNINFGKIVVEGSITARGAGIINLIFSQEHGTSSDSIQIYGNDNSYTTSNFNSNIVFSFI